MTRLPATALMAIGVAATLARAASAASTNIVISISGCEAAAVQADRLFDLARAELAPRIVVPGDGARDARAPHLSVRLCQGSANGVTIEWQDFGAAMVVRQLDLSDVVGDMRTRTLAVALAELVAAAPVNASTMNRQDNGALDPAAPSAAAQRAPPKSPPTVAAQPILPLQRAETLPPGLSTQVPPVATVEPTSNATSRAPALRARAGVALREFFNPQTMFVGPWLSVATRRFAGEAQFLTTRKDVTQGAATLGTVTLYDAGVAAIYQAVSWGSSIVVSANLRAEVGNTWARGEPGNTINIQKLPTKSGARLAAALDLMADTVIVGDFGLQLRVLVGGDAWGVTAQAFNQAVASTEGVFAGIALGLNYKIID